MDLTVINEINEQLKDTSAEEILSYFINEYKDKIALASSLSAEDQVLTDMIVKIDKNIKIFTLDTGRLFQETYDLIERTNNQYDIKLDVYFPDTTNVEKMTKEKGINLFYESVENRKYCCHIRKIEPLKRAFKDLDVWICGLRKEQSITRKDINLIEWDSDNNLIKVNPLLNWSNDNVWSYIRNNNVPYNKLHDRNYPSIGCLPCTRAVMLSEDIRAGRWWWEKPENKECGLHVKRS